MVDSPDVLANGTPLDGFCASKQEWGGIGWLPDAVASCNVLYELSLGRNSDPGPVVSSATTSGKWIG